MEEYFYLSATELAARLRRGNISAVDVVTAHLERIAAVNPRLNAVVQLDAERALSRAQAADAAIAAALARGDSVGPLHGVPFTVKDVVETTDVIAAAGLRERATLAPTEDAVVVARMRAAGAILLGKTNCPPGGGGGDTDNPVYGRTNNPYDLTRTPGGSSGGEAAIIAAGGSPMGLGSDSGGSIRVPAHFCGVAGLKPTSGRVPNTGVFNHPGGLSDPRTQIGPLARSVEDLALLFGVIAGPDGRDSGVVPLPVTDYRAVRVSGLRVACYADDGVASPTVETSAATLTAAQALADFGARVMEVRPPIAASRGITERYWNMSALTGAGVETLFSDWDAFRTAMLVFMADYDAIVCPVDAHPAPKHGDSDPLRFNYTLPYSLTGWPVVVVRVGSSPEGLPIGIQIIAHPWREDVALAVAMRLECDLGGWQPALSL
ncbi:MAG: amidase [Anaerolineae bacterium]|nr:amidase [Anaerolineae bacterium]